MGDDLLREWGGGGVLGNKQTNKKAKQNKQKTGQALLPI